jgi:hypothetical protein
MKLSTSLTSLWARPTTASCQTQSGFGSWGGWPLSPAANLVGNTIFTSAGLKWSRHANKVPCTVWARSFLTWAGQASRATSGRGRKHALSCPTATSACLVFVHPPMAALASGDLDFVSPVAVLATVCCAGCVWLTGGSTLKVQYNFVFPKV